MKKWRTTNCLKLEKDLIGGTRAHFVYDVTFMGVFVVAKIKIIGKVTIHIIFIF